MATEINELGQRIARAETRIEGHENLCAARYKALEEKLERVLMELSKLEKNQQNNSDFSYSWRVIGKAISVLIVTAGLILGAIAASIQILSKGG